MVDSNSLSGESWKRTNRRTCCLNGIRSQKHIYTLPHGKDNAYMACNFFNMNHVEYTKKLSPYVKHYHIADAYGVDGEGLQIGEGTVDFKNILNVIKKSKTIQSFIPEIWQGHKNNGEGFWIALKELENKF